MPERDDQDSLRYDILELQVAGGFNGKAVYIVASYYLNFGEDLRWVLSNGVKVIAPTELDRCNFLMEQTCNVRCFCVTSVLDFFLATCDCPQINSCMRG
jgi:hypothetical protein